MAQPPQRFQFLHSGRFVDEAAVTANVVFVQVRLEKWSWVGSDKRRHTRPEFGGYRIRSGPQFVTGDVCCQPVSEPLPEGKAALTLN